MLEMPRLSFFHTKRWLSRICYCPQISLVLETIEWYCNVPV